MRIHHDIQTLRSKLAVMTRLTLNTLDRFVNAMQPGRPEPRRVTHNSGDEMSVIRCWFASHGRELLRAEAFSDADSRFVSATMRIAGALEVAYDAATVWLDEIEQGNVTTGARAHKTAYDTARSSRASRTVPLSETNSPCKVVALWNATPPHQALRLNPADDFCNPSRDLCEAVPTEDFTPARLVGLQQRVCELLVKNQQLRMALMAEKAESHCDQLC